MDPIDPFYQQLDSEALLAKHGPGLVTDAQEALRKLPNMRFAGVIAQADSPEAEPLRQALAARVGHPLPAGMLVGLFPRPMVEPVLRAHVDDSHWLEESWQPQTVLPVVVSTRDGFRFGFFGL